MLPPSINIVYHIAQTKSPTNVDITTFVGDFV